MSLSLRARPSFLITLSLRRASPFGPTRSKNLITQGPLLLVYFAPLPELWAFNLFVGLLEIPV